MKTRRIKQLRIIYCSIALLVADIEQNYIIMWIKNENWKNKTIEHNFIFHCTFGSFLCNCIPILSRTTLSYGLKSYRKCIHIYIHN